MDLKKNIERMEAELTDMKKQLEQQVPELKGGVGYYLRGWDKPVKGTLKADTLTVTRGAFRPTKELAKIADKNMVTRNLLEAYVHHIQGDGEGIHYVFFNKYSRTYVIGEDYEIHKRLTEVYMQKETAEVLCKALNKGEIEL